MENLFDCICSALAFPPNQTLFLKAEGIELMILSIKVRYASLKGPLLHNLDSGQPIDAPLSATMVLL